MDVSATSLIDSIGLEVLLDVADASADGYEEDVVILAGLRGDTLRVDSGDHTDQLIASRSMMRVESAARVLR